MARVAVTISLSDDERAELEALSRRRKTSQGLARRARIVLAAAEGLENNSLKWLIFDETAPKTTPNNFNL